MISSPKIHWMCSLCEVRQIMPYNDVAMKDQMLTIDLILSTHGHRKQRKVTYAR